MYYAEITFRGMIFTIASYGDFELTKRVLITNILVTVAAAILVAAVFLPIICVFAMVGGAFMGGCASLWKISPVLGSMVIVIVATSTGTALWRPRGELPSALLTAALCLAVLCAVGIAVLLIGILFIHFYVLLAVAAASTMFVAAAFVAKEPGQSIRFRFHLRTLLLCVTLAGLILGALRAVSNGSF